MKIFIFLSLLLSAVMTLSACTGKGYPGATPNLDICNPGHETSRDCPNRRHIEPEHP